MKKLLLLIDCLLAGLVVWTTVSLFVLRPVSVERKAPKVAHREDQSPPPSPWGDARPIESFHAVVEKDIFRTPKAPPKAGSKEGERIQQTALRLKLNGTIIGASDRSYAILLDGETKRQEVYTVNDFVRGARIIEIQPERVILSVAGVKEALDMNMESGPPSKPGAAKPQSAAPPSPHARPQVRRPPGSPNQP